MISPLVVAFGGGVDGTAMLVEMWRRGIRPDLIQFADTGNRDAEKPETYAHVDRMDAWCREKWGIGITWVRNDGMYGTLEANCLAKRMLPSIAYGFKSCSDKYKRRPQEKYVKGWPPAIKCWASGDKITKFIGYNADEWHRAHSIVEDDEYRYRYLLIELGIGRKACEATCLAEFGYVPVKSACKFCPSSKKSEILWLARVHPDLYDDCIRMEKNVDYGSKLVRIECPECDGKGCGFCAKRGYFEQAGNTVRGLGRNWSWAEIVAADEQQFKMFPEAPDAPCMCFDGGSEPLPYGGTNQ